VLCLSSGCGLLLDLSPPDETAPMHDASSDAHDASSDARAAIDAIAPLLDASQDAGTLDAGTACRARAAPAPSLGAWVTGDIVNMDACGAPSLDVGFRCKSYTICTIEQTCSYFTPSDNLGHLQSSERTYYDATTTEPRAVMLSIATGADSLCGDPPITIAPGEFLRVEEASGRVLDVWLPAWTGVTTKLYIGDDGRTYWDTSRTSLAGAPP